MPRPAALAAALAAAAFAAVPPAGALDKVSFGTDWRAQAEHGCFYQALATGLYREHGLDVTIRQGGPQANQRQLLLAGGLDFNMGSNGFGALNFVQEKIPFLAVASIFQKNPAVLIAHPGQGNDSLAALKGKPILISTDARATWWQFLKRLYGYDDAQIRPYTFNMAPFLADKGAIQQGYLSSEPYSIEKATGARPVVMLLADGGYNAYSTTIETARRTVDEKPDLVQRFVDATVKGCYAYHYRDPSPGNALIRRDNPEMTDDLIANGIKLMNEHGIVDSGDTKTLGIGAMTDARWESFFRFASEAGIYPKDLDWKQAYTLRFVNKRVGM